MSVDTEKQKTAVQKLRFYYSIAVPVILVLSFGSWIFYLNSTMASRRLIMQLQRAKNLAQLEQILRKSSVKLDDDKMAEVYINCALAAFNCKDYDESCKVLQKVIHSNAHPELIASAQCQLASSFILAGKFQEGRQQIDSVLNNPDIPPETKVKAQNLLQYIK